MFYFKIHEINDDLVVHKKVFRMTQLPEKYKAYLPADTGTYSSAKLQDRLNINLKIIFNSETLNLDLYLPAAAIASSKESLTLKTRFDIPWPR
jgi:hypothetical protein